MFLDLFCRFFFDNILYLKPFPSAGDGFFNYNFSQSESDSDGSDHFISQLFALFHAIRHSYAAS